MRQLTYSRRLKNIVHACRLIMGFVFVVSGFVKAIDPWGTMLKVEEYFVIYGWDSLIPWSIYFSIWLSGAELMMGLMLSFKVRIRFVSICALFSMTIFTIVALLSATILPVDDCGCFGEALKLTPWQTFFKNIAMLPMAFLIFWRYRVDKIFVFKRVEIALATIFFSIAMGLPTYCYRHLPLFDYLPYRVGVNLPEAILEAKSVKSNKIEVTLVFRNIKTGRLRNFSLENKAWHDSSKWEWVETITHDDTPDIRALVGEFSLRNRDGEIVTDEMLTISEVLHMIFIENFDNIDGRCQERIEAFIQRAQQTQERVIVVTPSIISEQGSYMGVECYNIDPTTMKTALRASYGVISLNDGVIVDKRNCRDM